MGASANAHMTPFDLMSGRSAEASALIAEASRNAAYERVLQRFRQMSGITAFTSNKLASTTAKGEYAQTRFHGKRRIAFEWVAETRRHRDENQKRATPPETTTEMAYHIDDLGTLALASKRVPIKSTNGRTSLQVTNTAGYPIGIYMPDCDTWLRTNTPLFLKPSTTTTITFETSDAKPLPAPSPTAQTNKMTAAISSLTNALSHKKDAPASSSSSSSSNALQPPPTLPCRLAILVKPCDPADVTSGKPMRLFIDENGQTTHRIGEKVNIEIIE